jgi:phosphoribosylanthranilate isomerase
MTRVKICGITNFDDARAAVDLGADALGFNFYSKSPRYISSAAAGDIISKLHTEVETFGVFVNASVEEIGDALTRTPIDIAQLHGDESPELVRELASAFPVRLMKALRVSTGFDPAMALAFDKAEVFLLDADSTEFGGSGRTFDWAIARGMKESIPKFYLAGGLTPQNVASAIRRVEPFGVDVCSGVEAAKGRKDLNKLAAFIDEVRRAL